MKHRGSIWGHAWSSARSKPSGRCTGMLALGHRTLDTCRGEHTLAGEGRVRDTWCVEERWGWKKCPSSSLLV